MPSRMLIKLTTMKEREPKQMNRYALDTTKRALSQAPVQRSTDARPTTGTIKRTLAKTLALSIHAGIGPPIRAVKPLQLPNSAKVQNEKAARLRVRKGAPSNLG